MARLPRLIIPLQAHYVLLTGNDGVPLFKERADFERMFNFIYEQSVREDVLVHAYTLLSSQLHLMVTPKASDSLSKMMQGLGRSYVRYFNHRYDREGGLWGGRYKSSVVQPGEWLKKCLIYMDYLPQGFGAKSVASALQDDSKAPANIQSNTQVDPQGNVLANALGNFEWSSHLHYTGRRNDVFITAHADIWNLGNTPFAREERYELLVQGGISVEDCQHIERAIRGGWALGDDTFIEHMQSLAHRRVAKAKAGRPRLHQAVA